MNTLKNCFIAFLAVFLVWSCEKQVTTETQKPVNPFTFLTTNDADLKYSINEYLIKNDFPVSTISEFDYEKIMVLGDKTTKKGVILIPDSDGSKYLFFSISENWIEKCLIMDIEKIDNNSITALIKTPKGESIVKATFDAKTNSITPEKFIPLKSMTEQDWLCAIVYTMFGGVTGLSYSELIREAIISEALKDGKAVISSSKLTWIGLAVSLAYTAYSIWACPPAPVYYDPIKIPVTPYTPYTPNPFQFSKIQKNPFP